MKIGAAPAGGTRATGQKPGDNRYQGPARGERQNGGQHGSRQDASLGGGSAMASAFAKLKR